MKKLILLLFLIPNLVMALPPCQSEDDFWDNCVGTYTFPQGHEYVGECKDNKRHGQGTYRVANVDIYIEGNGKNMMSAIFKNLIHL